MHCSSVHVPVGCVRNEAIQDLISLHNDVEAECARNVRKRMREPKCVYVGRKMHRSQVKHGNKQNTPAVTWGSYRCL
ncbi:unnamed protein product [Victoria cruziana]